MRKKNKIGYNSQARLLSIKSNKTAHNRKTKLLKLKLYSKLVRQDAFYIASVCHRNQNIKLLFLDFAQLLLPPQNKKNFEHPA
jgi:hypothetical protein